jgi:hypothetical protein
MVQGKVMVSVVVIVRKGESRFKTRHGIRDGKAFNFVPSQKLDSRLLKDPIGTELWPTQAAIDLPDDLDVKELRKPPMPALPRPFDGR